jgi:periplasmic protein TonB
MKVLLKFIPAILVSILFLFNNVQAQTKTRPIESSDTNDSNFYSKVEVEASFPGGQPAWVKYITKQIMQSIDQLRKKDYGTCIVKFIVRSDGYVSEVKATTMKNSRLAKIAVEAIENGPRWIPAQQNGKYVNAYRLQPVTLTVPDK